MITVGSDPHRFAILKRSTVPRGELQSAAASDFLCICFDRERPPKQPKAKLLEGLEQSPTLQLDRVIFLFDIVPDSAFKPCWSCCPVCLLLRKNGAPADRSRCIAMKDYR